VGVDIKPQPHYPFEFHQADALTYPLEGFDAYHASPPCQFGSVMTLGRWQDRQHPNHIPAIRLRLQETGKPFVIENVEGSREHLINPILLCGTMFGLGTKEGNQLRRHRYFEAPFFPLTPTCQHNKASAIGVYGGGQNPARRKPVTIGVWGHAGGSSNRDGLAQFGSDARREAMGIEWMTGNELSEAIPPAYTEYIGKFLMQAVMK
jgi:DNA (cytosine-5)-methyltransferase 1